MVERRSDLPVEVCKVIRICRDDDGSPEGAVSVAKRAGHGKCGSPAQARLDCLAYEGAGASAAGRDHVIPIRQVHATVGKCNRVPSRSSLGVEKPDGADLLALCCDSGEQRVNLVRLLNIIPLKGGNFRLDPIGDEFEGIEHVLRVLVQREHRPVRRVGGGFERFRTPFPSHVSEERERYQCRGHDDRPQHVVRPGGGLSAW